MSDAKPALSFWQIWNMCCGFLGLQFGFALQNANASRIFQSLGADLDLVPLLWIAAPLTGLLVQPVIGHLSDRTWTRLGRRRPYFLAGAVLAAAALWLMPRVPTLWMAAALLWVLDASLNIAMEPFRAFVGDQLPGFQRAGGYAMQSFFIGVGAVVGSLLPWLLTLAGVDSQVAAGAGAAAIPATVRVAFDCGAVVLLAALGWTVIRSREYPPERLLGFADAAVELPAPPGQAGRNWGRAALWIALGLAAMGATWLAGLDRQLYLLGAGGAVWGLALMSSGSGRREGLLATIMDDMSRMPAAMRALAPVQFFSWLGLFAMWIYTTPAVAEVHFGSSDPHSALYNRGADWVGVLFATYNGFAAVAAAVIPLLARRVGLRACHLINLWLGGLALLSFLVIRDPRWLLLPMVAMGFAWASIVSLPYALLSSSVPAHKMGIYMGIFNFFIVIPQLVAASVLGFLLKVLFAGAPLYALAIGGASFLVAGLLALRVPEAAVATPAPESVRLPA